MSDDSGGQPQGSLSGTARRFLKALASENRQQVMLLFADGSELSVGEVAARLGIGQSTASEQLAMLRDGGILTLRRDGKVVHYRADPAGIAAVLEDLRRHLWTCCPPPAEAPGEPGPGSRQAM